MMSFERLDSLTDPSELARILGPIEGIRLEPLQGQTSGFSSSSHKLVHVARAGGRPITLRLKRTHVGEDWIARLMRTTAPGREAMLLAEPRLATVWDTFARPYLAYAVEGGEVGLLMEDHSLGCVPDVREPVSLETEDRLMECLADFHGRFWQSPLLSLPWLTQPEWYADVLGPHQAVDPDALRGAPQGIRDGVSAGWREAKALLPAPVWERLTRPAAELWRAWSDLPRTLIHGDTKVANFAFLPDGRVAAFDWTNLGAAPATLDIGWYLAVNGTRLHRSKEDFIARYRELLEARLGSPLPDALWERMMDAAVFSGARMLLWSKAVGLRENTPYRRGDWDWWAERLAAWSRR